MKLEFTMGKKKHENPVTIYAQLREEYNDNNFHTISQAQLADKLKISRATLCRIENGTAKPKIEVMQKYCEIFGVTMDYLSNAPTSNNVMENTTLKSYGITKNTLDTFKMIKDISSTTENLSLFVNLFMGNKKQTLLFFNEMYSYLKTEYYNKEQNIENDFAIKQLMFSTFSNYIDKIVKPQLQKSLKKNYDWQNNIVENSNSYISNEEFEEMQQAFIDSHLHFNE